MKRWAFATIVALVELVVLILIFIDVLPLKPMHITEGSEYAKFFSAKDTSEVIVRLARWIIYLAMVVTLASTSVTILMELARFALNRRWRTHS